MHQVVEILNSMSKSVKSGEFNFFLLATKFDKQGCSHCEANRGSCLSNFFSFSQTFFFSFNTAYM